MISICPKCKINPSERRFEGRGKTPYCKKCRAKNPDPGHFDKNLVRYGTPGRKLIRTCTYCRKKYERHRRDTGSVPVCKGCLSKHKYLVAIGYKEKKKNSPCTRKEHQLIVRLHQKLRSAGLPLDYIERKGKRCGICGTRKPGGKGRWHIDHDHKCCHGTGRHVGCKKCVRGILCYHCNTGLGHFKNDPKRLRAAAVWVEK